MSVSCGWCWCWSGVDAVEDVDIVGAVDTVVDVDTVGNGDIVDDIVSNA